VRVRRLSSLLRPRNWTDAARGLAWRTRHRPLSVGAPTWPLAGELTEDFVIHWPVRYDWGPAEIWVGQIRDALARQVPVERHDIAQPYPGVVLMHAVHAGRVHELALDYLDYDYISDDAAARCPLYLKLQYAQGGYGLGNVVAGGYVAGRGTLTAYLPPVRRLADRADYSFEVYGRFGPTGDNDVRRSALATLREQDRFAYEGGLGPVGYTRYLQEVARARVCIDLPGRGEFCHRLIEYLAVGACVVGRRPRNVLHVPLVHGEHVAFVQDDYSDLVEVCARYVEDAAARERLRRSSRAFFDRYLHVDQLAGYYLWRVAGLVSAGSAGTGSGAGADLDSIAPPAGAPAHRRDPH
jgi:Glycosyl transferases group 1